MIRQVNTDVLIKHKINAHQFLIVTLLFQQKYDLLDEYLKTSNTYDSLKEDLIHLKESSLIHYNPDLSPYNYKTIMVSIDGINLLGNYNGFEEILNTYPLKVNRPDGKVAFLRQDRKNTEQIYTLIVKGDRSIHDHLVKCLKYEIDERTKTGSLKFMKTLYNWLADKEWKNYEDVVDYASSKINETKYGETIE